MAEFLEWKKKACIETKNIDSGWVNVGMETKDIEVWRASQLHIWAEEAGAIRLVGGWLLYVSL